MNLLHIGSLDITVKCLRAVYVQLIGSRIVDDLLSVLFYNRVMWFVVMVVSYLDVTPKRSIYHSFVLMFDLEDV